MKRHEKHDGFRGQRIVVVPRPVLGLAVKCPLLRHLLPTEAGYYPKAEGHVCSREAGARETIFIFCAEGAGWCEISGHRHEVTKGQLLVVPATIPHVYGAAEKSPWTICWFHGVGEDMPVYLSRLGVSAERPVVSLGEDVHLLALFEEVLEGLEHGFTETHLVYAAHALAHLMGLILRQKEGFWQGESSIRSRIESNMAFMKAHLREPLTVGRLASLANLSRSHYTTLFRRVSGYAPLSYLNHLRMQRAVQLLHTTDLSIKQISDQLGFSDPFYFSRAFKKVYNHSPSEHRLRYTV